MKPVRAMNIEIDPAEEGRVVYFRLNQESYRFLQQCKRPGIIGFEWDGTRNFGVILGVPSPEGAKR